MTSVVAVVRKREKLQKMMGEWSGIEALLHVHQPLRVIQPVLLFMCLEKAPTLHSPSSLADSVATLPLASHGPCPADKRLTNTLTFPDLQIVKLTHMYPMFASVVYAILSGPAPESPRRSSITKNRTFPQTIKKSIKAIQNSCRRPRTRSTLPK